MRRALLLTSLLAALLVGGSAAQTVSEYQVKAEFLERFTRFIEWPGPPKDHFSIFVVGRNPFGSFLDTLVASHRFKGKTCQVTYVDDAAQLTGADLVFISSSEKEHLPQILTRTSSHPILTIGDTEGFGAAGVLINFYGVGNTVRFEINNREVEKSGLHVDARLLKLARMVESGGRE